MINRIKQAIGEFVTNTPEEEPEEDKRVIVIDSSQIAHPEEGAPDFQMLGLFAEVVEEKIAELAHALLYLNEVNKMEEEPAKPVQFYLSTYGGAADDMFALYDIMRIVRDETPIHTIGLGKVMSAGVLLLAAGTKGERRIAKNCRIMIHSVMGGNQGDRVMVENSTKDKIIEVRRANVDLLSDEQTEFISLWIRAEIKGETLDEGGERPAEAVNPTYAPPQ